MRLLSLFATLAFSWTLVADDKKADDKKAPEKPTGAWVREADGIELRFTWKKDDVTIHAKAGDTSMTTTCKYEIDKEGVIKVTLGEIKTKGDFPAKEAKEGQEMTFKFKVDGKKAKLSDFKSNDLDHARAVIEGEYEVKKSD